MSNDRNEIRRRLLWRLFGTPLTLVPVLGGVSSMLLPVFFGVDPALPIFAGVVALTAGIGGVALRALLGRDTISQSILEEMETEQVDAHKRRMRRLAKRLENDGDDRTSPLLQDLLALVNSIRDDHGWRENVNPVVAADILGAIDDLFTGCLRQLERTLELADTLAKVTTPEARKALSADREAAVQQVSGSVAELGRYLSELRVLGTEAAPEQQLTRIRKDIDNSLAAARQTARETAGWADPEAELERRRKRARKETN